jgi:ABC-type transport system involved in multi-copper enzyme maturation permease subunit
VFVYEWLMTSRRWQPYALRAGFVTAILIGLALIWNQMTRDHLPGAPVSLQELADYGRSVFRTIAPVEMILILLAAPAATAGAVCLDKARGALDHMLVTELSNGEIVLGKLAARLIPVLGLVACTLPVVALTSLLGGIDPLALFGSFLVAIGCAVLGCSLAMTLSVYGRKTHEVLILTYLIVVLWVILPALFEVASFALTGSPRRLWSRTVWDWVELSNPLILPLVPYRWPARAGLGSYLGFLAGCLGLSVGLLGLATSRVRRVALSQAGRPAGGRRWRFARLGRPLSLPWLPGHSLEGNPVAWREWHRMRPSRMMRVAWGLYSALGLLCVWIAARPPSGPPGMPVRVVSIMSLFQVSTGLLLLSVGSATSLAEERVRGSLDVLLSTPMATRSILAGKWWGGFRRVVSVVIWPAATAVFLALDQGYWSHYVLLLLLVLAYGAVITSLGLAVATWVGRIGRAIALCVSIYVVFLIGWPILVVFGLEGRSEDAVITHMMIADPPMGTLYGTMCVSSANDPIPGVPYREETAVWMVVWIVIDFGIAALLFLATRATFDRCLGRIPDEGTRPGRPPGRSSLTQAELLALVPSASETGEEEFESEDE